MLRPYLEKKRTRLRTPISVKAQLGSFLYYISDKGRYRKTANAFGISIASISGNIRRVSYAVATFVGPKLIRLHTTEGEVQVLADKYLEVFGFQQYIGAIDEIHIEIAELRAFKSFFKVLFSVHLVLLFLYEFLQIFSTEKAVCD